MTKPHPDLLVAQKHVETWLTRCQQSSCVFEDEDWIFWEFQRDALGPGVVELIDDPDYAVIQQQLALSLYLDLPPIQTSEDAYALLSVAEALDGTAIVSKSTATDDDALAIQLKVPANTVTAETLPLLYRRLAAAKHYIEDETRA